MRLGRCPRGADSLVKLFWSLALLRRPLRSVTAVAIALGTKCVVRLYLKFVGILDPLKIGHLLMRELSKRGIGIHSRDGRITLAKFREMHLLEARSALTHKRRVCARRVVLRAGGHESRRRSLRKRRLFCLRAVRARLMGERDPALRPGKAVEPVR